ncbi:MAG: Ig-like domain-containing protein, partial [Bacteroidales bacterium]|nr:Ig-like domain-containing protein [Bacteroidales bacterium]
MRNFRLFLAVFLAACTFASCQEEIIKDAIVLDSSSSDDLIQVLESGETRGSSITFTTSGAWTSEIKSVAPRTKASPDWISLKPDHGNAAGDYTVDVVLSENETYSDRAAEIIIKSGDKSITMDITQKASPFVPVTAVKLSASSLALTEGDVARLTATVEPADATDKTVVWSSDSPEIAEVDQEGNVTAKS